MRTPVGIDKNGRVVWREENEKVHVVGELAETQDLTGRFCIAIVLANNLSLVEMFYNNGIHVQGGSLVWCV